MTVIKSPHKAILRGIFGLFVFYLKIPDDVPSFQEGQGDRNSSSRPESGNGAAQIQGGSLRKSVTGLPTGQPDPDNSSLTLCPGDSRL